jgi:hypothetical protein
MYCAARMAGASVQHKLRLHNLQSCDNIEAKENERWNMNDEKMNND